jgi:molybdopterin/thiamine biosynthesis adenylyltransferase
MGTITIPGPNDRYASQRAIRWWKQEVLAHARILVVGAGALGNEVLKNLALLGIGRIVIVDLDMVEHSNFSRSVLFHDGDEGCPKAKVCAQRLAELNPEIHVTPVVADITKEVGLGLFRRADVVVGCLDNRAARLAVNRACYHVGRPWVDGGLYALTGVLRVFDPSATDAACYECTLEQEDYELLELRYSCPLQAGKDQTQGKVPTTITSAAVIAALQTQETIKLLHNRASKPGVGYFFAGDSNQLTVLEYPRREDCMSHELEDGTPREELALSAEMTLGDFLRHMEAELGPGVQLKLDWDIVRQATCQQCGTGELIGEPYSGPVPGAWPCPSCDIPRMPEIIHTLDLATGLDDWSLKTLGIPPWDILTVRQDKRWHWIELTKDASLFAAFA